MVLSEVRVAFIGADLSSEDRETRIEWEMGSILRIMRESIEGDKAREHRILSPRIGDKDERRSKSDSTVRTAFIRDAFTSEKMRYCS